MENIKIHNKKTCEKNIILFKITDNKDIIEYRKGRKKNESLDRDQQKEEVL